MKRGSGLVSFLLFIVMIILLAGVGFFGFIIYKEMMINDSKEVSVVKTGNENEIEIVSEKIENKNIGETISDIFSTTPTTTNVTFSEKESGGKYFYEQLDENQKKIYNGLQQNKEKMYSGTYSIQYGDAFSDILKEENGSEKLGNDYQAAIEAYTHDNVDLFYIDISKLYLNIETRRKAFSTKYNVYIEPAEGKNYFANGFNSETDVRTAINKIEDEVNIIKSKCTGNIASDIKVIHDYLIEKIEYDEKNKSVGTYNIYGALVEKSCVCEGYAKAFKYLLEKVGIESILVQGIATNSEGIQEKHAWNAVNLNDKWYLVDVTWDDPIIVGKGFVKSGIHYKYYLKGSRTFDKDHKPEYTFSDGGKEFQYPVFSLSDY